MAAKLRTLYTVQNLEVGVHSIFCPEIWFHWLIPTSSVLRQHCHL